MDTATRQTILDGHATAMRAALRLAHNIITYSQQGVGALTHMTERVAQEVDYHDWCMPSIPNSTHHEVDTLFQVEGTPDWRLHWIATPDGMTHIDIQPYGLDARTVDLGLHAQVTEADTDPDIITITHADTWALQAYYRQFAHRLHDDWR